jgi:moderate conductance mechanosensitive channel
MSKVIPLLLFALLLTFSCNAAHAQSDGESGGGSVTVTPEKIGELSGRLTREQQDVLAQLVQMLVDSDGVAEEVAKPDKYEEARRVFATYRHFVWTNVTGIVSGIGGAAKALYLAAAGRDTTGANLTFLGKIALTLLIAFGVEMLIDRYVRTARQSGLHKGASTYANAESLAQQLSILGRALARDLADEAAFAVAALIAAALLFRNPTDASLAQYLIIFPILLPRLVSAVLRFILAPFEPEYRMVTTNDWTATFIYRHLVGITLFGGVALFLISTMNLLSVDGVGPLTFWLGLILYALVIYVTWRARYGLTSILRGGEESVSPGLERMASWWPPLSIALIVFEYLAAQIARATDALEISPGAAVSVLAIIVITPFLDTMMRGLVRHLVPPMQGEGPIAEAAYNATRNSYVRIGRVVLFALLILVIGWLLGISIRSFAEAGLGAQIAAKGVGFLMIIAVGYLVWELVNLLVNRRLVQDIWEEVSGAQAEHEQGEGYGAGKSRMATILPLIRLTLQIATITITVLLALSQLGVNITPLLAGAGVFGLAIGFGAQTLVKDVVSGVFFLLDDAFRIGEYIEAGGIEGTVEKISVRSLQLRHPNGPVHIVPYGEIARLTNSSRDYVIMKLKFTVPFDTDIEKVRKLFKKIGQQMMEDPVLQQSILEPFKSQGVIEVNDVGIVLRGKFTAKPGMQWVVRKEVYSRVQQAFAENGIQFARREVHVRLNDEEEETLRENQKKAISAAAASAVAER